MCTRHPDLVFLAFYAIPIFHILEFLHLLHCAINYGIADCILMEVNRLCHCNVAGQTSPDPFCACVRELVCVGSGNELEITRGKGTSQKIYSNQ